MKVRSICRSGRIHIEFEASTQKEIFKGLAAIEEIFAEEVCGACGNKDIRYVVRTVEGNDFHEIHCEKCRAKLAFGQHKTGGSLFPKRKDEEGQWLKDRGWQVWRPKSEDGEQENSKPSKGSSKR